MRQVFCNVTKDSPSTSASNYNGISCGYADGFSWNVNPANRYMIMPFAGRISRLSVWLDTAPGVGKNYTFAIYKNGVAVSPSVTISDSATSGADDTNSISFVAGDKLCLRSSPSGTPTAPTQVKWSAMLESTTSRKFFIGNNSAYSGMSATLQRFVPMGNTQGFDDLVSDAQQTAPLDATIREFYIDMNTAPGVGKSWRMSIYKNGVEEASSIVDIVDTATTGNVTGLAIDVAPGDMFCISIVPSGTPTLPTNMGFGIGMDADIPGESWIASTIYDATNSSATEYNALSNIIFKNWSGTESDFLQKCGSVGFYLKKMFVYNYFPITSGNYIATVRKNSADTALAVTINNSSAGDQSNLTDIIKIGPGDEMSIKIVPNSPDATSSTRFSYIQYIPPSNSSSTLLTLGVG